jgi:hypothetical protein
MTSRAAATPATARSAASGVTVPASGSPSRKQTSGSTRGWMKRPASAAAPSSTTMASVSRPQITSSTPIWAILARLVKPSL